MLYPSLKEMKTSNVMTERFRGLNKGLRTGAGEFSDMENITLDYYPVTGSRRKRGTVTALTSPAGLAAKDSLVYADGADLYYNGEKVAGIVLSTADGKPKTFVSMGAYLCIFPDKLYLNTADMTDFGYMEASWESQSGTEIKYSVCKGDGTAYASATVSDSAPSEPENGALWIDTSGDVHVLKQYSQAMAVWSEIATVYIKIEAAGIGQSFAKGDGVRISGCAYSGSDTALNEQLESLNTLMTIAERGDNYIVVTGILDNTYTQTASAESRVSVKRRVPKIDFVCECQNRLWGCYYGIEDGRTVNEIFCSKLGDFKNWEVYSGISTDSFRASCGTDGEWTGAVTYMGYPMFFKENYIHKVYVSSMGAHQIVSSAIDGVQKGSDRSFAIVNDCLFYKARNGIMIFDGSKAECISQALGDEAYFQAVGGRLSGKYYVSMKDGNQKSHLFVYDSKIGCWVREDGTNAMGFADADNDLYYIDADTNELKTVNGTAGIREQSLSWEAVMGTAGYEYAQKKYLSRFNLRMSLEEGCHAEIYIQYDSSGIWEKHGVIRGRGVNRSFAVPVIPRRCDYIQIKLKGMGEFRLYSFAAVLEKGSDM